MRIVYVSWEYPPQFGGGIGTYVHATACTLAARGHTVTVVTITEQPFPHRRFVDGVTVIGLPQAAAREEGPVATLRGWQDHADALAEFLKKLARGGQVDLIEFCDYRGEGATFLHATTPNERPVCVTRLHTPMCVLHAYNPGQARYAVLEAFENQALLASDRIVSPSRVLRREMRDRLGEDLAIELSPHPVDPLFLAAHPPVTERNEALYVGRLEERKGVETLAAAAGPFLDACPDARLVLIGGDTVKSPRQPSMRQVVRDAIARRHRDRVELIDRMPREDLLPRYQAARFCVFPSHFENFPNTCLEAMALGRCVIGTRNSGMAEMIEDGISGLLVPSADAAGLAEAMIRVQQMEPAARTALGQAARRRIQDRYHPDVIAADLERLYDGFLSEHPYQASVPGVMMTERPAVAVVIPCYNHGCFLPDAITSVKAQDYPHVECVVVDDGSEQEETRQALHRAQKEGTRVIRQSNQGLSAARNAGVRATSAPFFVPLDADDRIAPQFISKLLPPLRADPTLGYCYSHAELFGAAQGVWASPTYDPQRLLVENLSVATAVVRRVAFDEAGGYGRDMVHGFEDWDFWLALLSLGYHGRCVPEPLFEYRKHAGGSMLDRTQQHRAEMIRRMIEHHRSLFALSLEVSLARKDSMFFEAHMDAVRLRESIVRRGEAAPRSTVDDALYQSLLARAELDYIENSRLWRWARRVGRTSLGRAIVGTTQTPPADRDDPCRRVAWIKASRAYRVIQWVKRTPAYKWYGRRRHGPDFDKPPAAAR